ncbi:MAG: response regulator [bacterium]|nr:response regulator [bacterium]
MALLRRGAVLVVDDERGMCHILKRMLTDEGYQVETAASGEEALPLIDKHVFDVAMVDVRMPGMDGLQLLDEFRQRSPQTSVIMMTAFGAVETAVNAMKRGAYEYISKPFNNDEIIHIVHNAFERKRLLDRNQYLTSVLEERESMGGMIGQSRPMQQLYRLIEKAAPTDGTVLILGESGTGKELVANAIHQHSDRAKGPFVAVNCGALPRELIESELFGHEKGSFSGAHQSKIGLIESADGGTLFLDEIGDLPMDLQVKILRVLEQKEVRRIGSVSPKSVDVRVVAATNRDLKKEAEKKTFREDLYFRLSIVEMRLPPLREREGDAPLLVEHFIRRFNQKMNRSVEGVSPEAMRALLQYRWPGNVRELENLIQRCMILRETGLIELSDLPDYLSANEISAPMAALFDPNQLSFQKAREAFERRYLEELLKINDDNVTKSALQAGISRRHLQDLIKKHGLKGDGADGENE